jgi:hypothetical protein
MKKPTIATMWLVGLAVILVGGAVASIATVMWLAHVVNVTADGSTYQPDSFFWTTVAFWWTAAIVAAAGIAIQVAAWVGAVMNTQRLADKAWFHALLWFGIAGIATSPIFGLGALLWWGVTIAYMIAGPDAVLGPSLSARSLASTPTTLAPTS